MFQNLRQIANHLLANTPNKSRTLRRDANHDLAPIIPRDRAHHVAEIFEAGDQTARCCGGVPHFLRNCRHREHFFLVEIGEKEKLYKRNIARRELLAQMQQKTALHFKDNVREPFRIRTNLIARTSCKRGGSCRIQGDKAKMRVESVKPCPYRKLANPRLGHRLFRQLPTTCARQHAPTHSTGLTRKAHAIPAGQLE